MTITIPMWIIWVFGTIFGLIVLALIVFVIAFHALMGKFKGF